MPHTKKRLDLLVVEKGLAASRQRAQALILSGKILVNHQRIDKPGTPVSTSDVIRLKGDDIPFVSRGGLKLESALREFQIDVENKICLDVGASTGGFTDCLLQHGAKKVFAVDVGYGQLAWQLRQNPRVKVIERTNIRHMPFDQIGQFVDLIVIDVSFISLKIVVPCIQQFMQPTTRIIVLIKPQFEVGKGRVGKGGVVRNTRLHAAVIEDLTVYFSQIGLQNHAVTASPIKGPKGNVEFLMLLSKKATDPSKPDKTTEVGLDFS